MCVLREGQSPIWDVTGKKKAIVKTWNHYQWYHNNNIKNNIINSEKGYNLFKSLHVRLKIATDTALNLVQPGSAEINEIKD